MNGTLTRNTEPHQKCSSSQPPVIGPMAHAEPGDAGPGGDGPGPLLGIGEQVGDDRQRGRHHERRPEAHEGPGGDQGGGAAGEGRQHRADAEDGHADEERAAAPVAVAEAPRREQEPGEHQDVGVDDPLQVAGRRVELVDERRQGDVEDRVVEDDQQQAQAQDPQRQPPPILGVAGGRHGKRSFRNGAVPFLRDILNHAVPKRKGFVSVTFATA